MSKENGIIKSNGRTYTKVAGWQTTQVQDDKPKPVVVELGLTVFLGGAGMVGDYNQDMINALHKAGVKNAVYGNYSALSDYSVLPDGLDQSEYFPSTLDMLGDAAHVVFFNQADTDPIAFHYGEDEEKRWFFDLLTVPNRIRIPQDTAKAQKMDFSLSKIGVSQSLPKIGQFNLIGYSWGSVIVARSAIYYARRGQIVNHLVLIGAPINKSLLDAVKGHANIKNTIVIDLKNHGDPIYAGMTDEELVDAAPKLTLQMVLGDGHFYYSGADATGKTRRKTLAETLYQKGLR